MWSTVLRLLGLRDSPASPTVSPAAPEPAAVAEERPADVRDEAAATDGKPLPARLIAFAEGLCAGLPPGAPAPELTEQDIIFLEGLVTRLQRPELGVGMLPEVTLQLSEMLRRGDLPTAQYVDLITQDAALSVEVLKAANSAFYAHSARTTSLHEAVMRLGLARLQAILMMALVNTRVLKAGPLRGHADLLVDLALPLASAAGAVAQASGGSSDLAYMRGMLLHLEHLLILGTVGDISREHRAVIAPSNESLLLAFERSGPDVRQAIAIAWKLEDILLPSPNDADVIDYAGLRRAVVSRWLRQPLPDVRGVSPERLADVMKPVAPRVPVTRGDAAPSPPTPFPRLR